MDQINSPAPKRINYLKVFLQVLGAGIGLLGLFMVICWLIVMIGGILSLDKEEIWVIVGFLPILFIGLYLIYVAYMIIMRFSREAINSLCFIISLVILIKIPHLTEIKKILRHPNPADSEVLIAILLLLLPFIIAIIFYKISSKLLLKWYDSTKDCCKANTGRLIN